MGFLDGAISGLSHIFHGIGNFFDGNDDEEQKKQQQQAQQARQATQKVAPAPRESQQDNSLSVQPTQAPDITQPLQKVQPKLVVAPPPTTPDIAPPTPAPVPAANTLQKAQTSVKSPAQMRAQATLNSLGGPVNPSVNPIAAANIGHEFGFGQRDLAEPSSPLLPPTPPVFPARQTTISQLAADNAPAPVPAIEIKAPMLTAQGQPIPIGSNLVKAPLSPAQIRAAATLKSLGGPVDPNTTSPNPNVFDDINQVGKGISDTLGSVNKFPQTPVGRFLIGGTPEEQKSEGLDTLTNAAQAVPVPGMGLATMPSDIEAAAKGVMGAANLVKAVPGVLAKGASALKSIPEALSNAPEALANIPKAASNLLQKAPVEARGVTSMNPTQAADAVAQHVESLPDEQLAHPDVVAAANGEPPAPGPVTPGAMHPTELDALDQLNKASKTQILTPQESATRDALQAKQDGIAAVNAPVEEPPAPVKAAPADLDTPAYQRQGLPEPVAQSPLDIPTFQRNNAQAAVDAAQAKFDSLNKLQKAAPTDPEAIALQKQELAAAKAQGPKEYAEVLKKQLLQKTVSSDADAKLAPIREKAASELASAKVLKQAQEAVHPTALETTTPVAEPAVAPTATPPAPEKVPPTEPAAPTPSKAVPEKPVGEKPLVKSSTSEAPAKAKAPAKTPQSELPDVEVEGSAKTGDTGKSQGKFSKGQEYEKTSQEASHERGAAEAANTSYDQFVSKIEENGAMSGADRDTAVELQQRYKPGSEEHRKLGDLVNKYHTEAAQTMSTIDRTLRKTATSDQLTSRFANKLYASSDDPLHIGEDDFKSVIAKNEEFTAARDARNAALDDFNKDPSKENANKFAQASSKFDQADTAAKNEEYQVAKRVGKDSSNPKTKTFIDDLGKKAGIYTMDHVDSSMLSSTRVMLNNFINTLGGRSEESIFGKAGAALARKLTGVDIGGGSQAGAKLGSRLGGENWAAAAELRKGGPGNPLMKAIKNVVTSGNTIGDRNTYAAAYSGILDHYTQVLKKAGYAGDELKHRALVNSIADPDGVVDGYMNQALTDNAMSSMTSGHNVAKFETWLSDGLSRKMGDSAIAKTVAKAVTRVTVGFPTVVIRSAEQGLRRTSLGSASVVQAGINIAKKGPPEETARLIKNAVKEAGSGATMISLGGILGSQGIITGSYPTDKNEQTDWATEGKTADSIKIAGNWYSLPSTLGVFALPFMLGANGGRNLSEGKPWDDKVVQSTISTLAGSVPTDSLTNALKAVSDAKNGAEKPLDKYLAQTGASLVRAVTPMGSLINEVAKIFDPTANDTTQGNALAQFVAKIQDGIPGAANQLPDKTTEGNVIKEPGPLARILGSSSAEQSAGVASTKQSADTRAAASQSLKDNGAYSDAIRNVVGKDMYSIFDAAKAGKPVNETDMKKLTAAMTKGVSPDQSTRFLEDGDYKSNLAVLHAKRDQLAADPTTRKSDLDKYDMQIKRGQVLQKGKYDPIIVDDYKNTSVADWRKMGDPNADTYDQKKFDLLWQYDSQLAQAGASGDPHDPTNTKFTVKPPGKGKSGSGSRGGAGGSATTNTLNATPNFQTVNLADLAPQKITAAATIPTIQQIKPGDLIKKRAITVTKA